MANVKIIEREGRESIVIVSSSHNKSASAMSYSSWQEIKDLFGIDEETIDAYDYVRKYIDSYGDIAIRMLGSSCR